MSQARLEILKLVAEGKLSPEEADRMIRALEEAPSGDAPSEPPPPPGGGGTPGLGETLSQVLDQVGETVRGALDDAAGGMRRVFEEHRPGTEAVDVAAGGFELPEGARLKVQPAFRVSFGGTSRGGHVTVRPSGGAAARIVRGEAVEVHRSGTDYVLTWAKGALELELPGTLSALEIRSLGGDIDVQNHPGPMSLETAGGGIRAHAVRSPIRARSLGGRIGITGLELREGASSISTTGGDVMVQAEVDSSVSIRASTLGGAITFPPGAEREPGRIARRRATAVIGDGKAELRIDTLGGDVTVAVGGEEA